jgi:cytochrome c553
MADFKSDKTTATVMNRIAKGYQDTDFVNLARFFSRSGGIR